MRTWKRSTPLLPNSEVDIQIFCPSTGLFTLYLAATQEQGELYIPSYHIQVESGEDSTVIFFGQLDVRGTSTTFRKVIDKFYDGNTGKLAMTLTWGGQESRDTELLDFIGIEYRSYRMEVSAHARRLFAWRNSTWHEIDPDIPLRSLATFVRRQQTFMRHLVTKIGRRMKSGFVDCSDTDAPLRKLAEHSKVGGRRYRVSETPAQCDECNCAFAEEEFLIEFVVPELGGKLTTVCADCVADMGTEFNPQKSNIYKRINPETWQIVAVDPPEAYSS